MEGIYAFNQAHISIHQWNIWLYGSVLGAHCPSGQGAQQQISPHVPNIVKVRHKIKEEELRWGVGGRGSGEEHAAEIYQWNQSGHGGANASWAHNDNSKMLRFCWSFTIAAILVQHVSMPTVAN